MSSNWVPYLEQGFKGCAVVDSSVPYKPEQNSLLQVVIWSQAAEVSHDFGPCWRDGVVLQQSCLCICRAWQVKSPSGDSLWTCSACGNAAANCRRDEQALAKVCPCHTLPSLPLMVKVFALAAQVQLEWVKLLPLKWRGYLNWEKLSRVKDSWLDTLINCCWKTAAEIWS